MDGKALAKIYMDAFDEAYSRTLNETYAQQVAAIVTMTCANRPEPQHTEMTSQLLGKFIMMGTEASKKKPKPAPKPKKEDEENEP